MDTDSIAAKRCKEHKSFYPQTLLSGLVFADSDFAIVKTG